MYITIKRNSTHEGGSGTLDTLWDGVDCAAIIGSFNGNTAVLLSLPLGAGLL